jgi:hypothetical protein
MNGSVLWLLAAIFMAGLFFYGIHLVNKEKHS